MKRDHTESTPTLEEIEERLRRLETEAAELRAMLEDKRLAVELLREATKAGAATAEDEAANHRPPRRRLEVVRGGQDHLNESGEGK